VIFHIVIKRLFNDPVSWIFLYFLFLTCSLRKTGDKWHMFLQPGCPVCLPTCSVKLLKGVRLSAIL